MSKKAINKLNKAFAKYDLQVTTTTVNEMGTLPNGNPGLIVAPAVLATITIFEFGEKGAQISKKSTAYGTGKSFNECQSNAIELAVEGLGL